MGREQSLDAVADVLRAIACCSGGERAVLTVRADGRAELIVEDGHGFLIARREADTLPGGPLPPLGVALRGLP